MIEHHKIYLTTEGAEEGSYLWCQDRISDDDIEYVRAPSRDELIDIIKKLRSHPLVCFDEDLADEILERMTDLIPTKEV